MSEIRTLKVNQVHTSSQDRTQFNRDGLEDLARSIQKHGLLQPISVRKNGDGYIIIAGERRWRAHIIAGLDTIDAIIHDLSQRDRSMLQLIENVSREDLDPIDEAVAYQSRMDAFGMTIDEIAQEAGVSTVRVKFRIKLLHLRPDLQKLVRDGQLELGYAQIISDGHLDHNRQLFALAHLRDNPSPTPQWLRCQVSQLREEQDQDALFDLDSLTIQEIEAIEPEDLVEPPLPSTTAPPSIGETIREVLTNQVTFWQEAANRWDDLGKVFKKQECSAAAQALNYALNAL